MAERRRIDGNPKANRYGQYYWMVELVDGGWVSLHANRAEVSGGAAIFYGTFHTWDDLPKYDAPKGAEYPVVAFGAGQWKTFYAASTLDGDPVAVDRWGVPE